MITIEINDYELKITGHAEFEEKGKDIVCAGISTLFYTLYEVLLSNMNMLEENSLKAEMEDGNGLISCKPIEKFEGNVQTMYMTILTGFNLLATNYKEFITFVVGRKTEKE